MNRSYIYAERGTLLSAFVIFMIVGFLIGLYLGYSIGSIKEARPNTPMIADTIITAKPVPITEPIPQEVSEPIDELPASNEEVDLIALITMAEAEGEPEMGKRLVIDTILNRVDSGRFPNSIRDVIYASGQFECTWNGRLDRCYVKEDIRKLVIEELKNRTRHDIHYFRAGHYHGFGKPIVQVGNHYFSTY